MRKLSLYIQEVRAPFFTASVMPVVLGTIVAYRLTGAFNLSYLILVLFGSVFLHAGANVANDYFDYRNGNDDANKDFVRPFTGGSRLIQKGLLSLREVLLEFIILYAAGLMIFSFLALKAGYPVMVLCLLGIFSGYFYVAPPLFLVSRGIGELLVGLNFGPLLCSLAYYIQTGSFSPAPFFASLPLAFLVTAILYVNEFPDYAADKLVGKNNLVVRFGRKKAVYGYLLLLVFVYMVTLTGVIFGIFPKATLLIFITLPLAFLSMDNLSRNYFNPAGLKASCVLTVLLHLAGGLLFTAGYML